MIRIEEKIGTVTLIVQVEESSKLPVKELHKFRAQMHELYHVPPCPSCKIADEQGLSGTAVPAFRQHDNYSFYEYRCSTPTCEGWQYAFGQAKEGGRLFPKGWTQFTKGDGQSSGGTQGQGAGGKPADEDIPF